MPVGLTIRLTDSSSSSVPSTLGEELSADTQAAIADYGETFIWKGSEYPCVLNRTMSSLAVAKSLFNAAVYPVWGDVITIGGKDVQVLMLNQSETVPVAGGFVADKPLIDPPSSPTLSIGFGDFISR